ncbi:MAG TPA: ABC transporter permease [Rubrobacter sp.]|nr:ABC transporter permease [Rubrobacter sp.]
MRALTKMTWIETKLFLREPIAIFFTLAFPVLILLLFSAIFGNEPVPNMPGVRSVDVQAPGYTTMVIGTTALLGLPITLAAYRRQGVLRRLRATPLHPSVILVAQVLVNLLMTVLGIAIMLVAAWLVYDLRLPEAPLAVAFAFLFATISFFALGFVLAGLLPSERTATVVGQVVYFPMLFLSGAVVPRELFPETLHRVSDFLPLTHVVNLIQELWIEGTWNLTALVVLLGLLVVSVAVSARTFRWE